MTSPNLITSEVPDPSPQRRGTHTSSEWAGPKPFTLEQWPPGVFATEYGQVGYQDIGYAMLFKMNPMILVSLIPFFAEPLRDARPLQLELRPLSTTDRLESQKSAVSA